VNNAFQSGAWLTISGWKFDVIGSDGSEGDRKADIEATEAAINTTFFVPVDCGGYAYLPLIESVAHIYIAFFLCQRTLSVNVYPNLLISKYPGQFSSDNRVRNSGAVAEVPVTCGFINDGTSSISGSPMYFCNCAGWSGLLTLTKYGQTNSASFSITG
jgi:hypothetical protein